MDFVKELQSITKPVFLMDHHPMEVEEAPHERFLLNGDEENIASKSNEEAVKDENDNTAVMAENSNRDGIPEPAQTSVETSSNDDEEFDELKFETEESLLEDSSVESSAVPGHGVGQEGKQR